MHSEPSWERVKDWDTVQWDIWVEEHLAKHPDIAGDTGNALFEFLTDLGLLPSPGETPLSEEEMGLYSQRLNEMANKYKMPNEVRVTIETTHSALSYLQSELTGRAMAD